MYISALHSALDCHGRRGSLRHRQPELADRDQLRRTGDTKREEGEEAGRPQGEEDCQDLEYDDSISIVIDHPDSEYEHSIDYDAYVWWVDYDLAIKNGSNMIRIGSKIFGERNG